MQKRSMWVILLAALVVSSAIGALAVQAVDNRRPAAIELPQVESGALVHREAADLDAAGWQRDAVLVHVAATEGIPVHGRVDPPLAWDTTDDPFVGNGKALVWTVTYASPSVEGSAFWVSIGGDGGVLYARELRVPYWCCHEVAVDAVSTSSSSPPSEPAPAPMSRGVYALIDAPEAMASVAHRPEFEAFAEDHPVFLSNIELVPGEDHSMWLLSYQTATVYGAAAVVDAKTGEVLHIGEWPSPQPPCCTPPPPPVPCCQPPDHHATSEGTVGTQPLSVEFPVNDVHWLGTLRVEAEIADALPTESFTLEVFDSLGRIVWRTTGNGQLSADIFPALTSGVYTASLQTFQSRGLPLRDVAASLRVDVEYNDYVGNWMGATSTFYGDITPMSETTIPLHNEFGLTASALFLSWPRNLPRDNLEIDILDDEGNVWASARGSEIEFGTGTLELELPESMCCLSAVVRHVGEGVQSVEFTLLAAFERPDVAYSEPTHHREHAH
jgi:hypothetical protein